MYTNIMATLTDRDVERLERQYPRSYVFLIYDVHKSVRDRGAVVKNPYNYIMAYARNVGWNDEVQGERDIMDTLFL